MVKRADKIMNGSIASVASALPVAAIADGDLTLTSGGGSVVGARVADNSPSERVVS